MAIQLPPLPWPKEALVPHISAETIDFHYGKHHNAYVNNLNKLIDGTPQAKQSLEDIVRNSEGGVFNNAAQVYNHTFYWHCLKPRGGGTPSGRIGKAIDEAFGGFAKFREEFSSAAATQFGSGWAWLVRDADGRLKIAKTANADTPIAHRQTPLLTIDVWEHAYYIDYRNDRPKYIDTFLTHLVNWEFVEKNLG
ncbi:MAG: superoxide dismutase [Gammaproteobacteria bacterium]|nr:superoxide dismutase [Gammaproteobacteria bacterium]QOJ32135.1 MAG: superoxide dismutase [Gammaproteobacteria bacterium]